MEIRDYRYVRALKNAYFLEVLGEAVYLRGAQKLCSEIRSNQWDAFALTEAKMRLMLRQELKRVAGCWKPSLITTSLAKGLGYLAGLLSSALLASIVRRVVNQRRYARLAMDYSGLNPCLWGALAEHEVKQVEYFNRRWT